MLVELGFHCVFKRYQQNVTYYQWEADPHYTTIKRFVVVSTVYVDPTGGGAIPPCATSRE